MVRLRSEIPTPRNPRDKSPGLSAGRVRTAGTHRRIRIGPVSTLLRRHGACFAALDMITLPRTTSSPFPSAKPPNRVGLLFLAVISFTSACAASHEMQRSADPDAGKKESQEGSAQRVSCEPAMEVAPVFEAALDCPKFYYWNGSSCDLFGAWEHGLRDNALAEQACNRCEGLDCDNLYPSAQECLSSNQIEQCGCEPHDALGEQLPCSVDEPSQWAWQGGDSCVEICGDCKGADCDKLFIRKEDCEALKAAPCFGV